jgi:hypothetical protein
MSLVATGAAEPISSSPPPGRSGASQPAVRPPITPVLGAGVRDASGDPLHHTTLLTPPPTILPGSLVTPDATQQFLPIKRA